MNPHNRADQAFESWLVDGPTRMPEHLVDSIVTQLEQTHQRKHVWLPGREQMNRMMVAVGGVAAIALIAVIGFYFLGRGGGGIGGVATPAPTAVATPSAIPTPSPTATPVLTPSPSPLPSVALMKEGPLTPGRYRYVLQTECDALNCPAQATPPPDLGIEVTVPAGWQLLTGAPAIGPKAGRERGVPNDAMLLMGWTNFYAGLNSDPCRPAGDSVPPDIAVGPSVDDFVNAMVARPDLDVSEPIDVSLGQASGRFFTLTTPSDISGCDRWVPWEPGIYAQGNSNLWDVWVVDVDGRRVVIQTEAFAETAADVKAELRQMVESITFVQ